MKHIMFFDGSITGQVGGSHRCLLLILKHLPNSEFDKTVVLNSDNALMEDFRENCNELLIWNGPSAALFAQGYGRKSEDLLHNGDGRTAGRIVQKLRVFRDGLRYDVFSGSHVVLKCYRLLKHHRIDLVHLNNAFDPYWIIAARLAGIPVVVHARGHLASIYPPFCHWVDRVICISEHVRDFLIGKGISAQRTVRIHDAIDTEGFEPDKTREQVRAELGIENNRPTVAIFGNIQRWKGQKTVIQACERLLGKYPSILCCIFGGVIEHSYADELQEIVRLKNMGNHVLFAGYRGDVADCMNAADVIVHASVEPEPFGMVVLEAMTVGKPVIASNDGAPPEIIEEKVSGLLCEPGNDRQLAEQMDLLLSHPELAARIGQAAAREAREYFDIRRQVAHIRDIHQSVLNKSMGRV